MRQQIHVSGIIISAIASFAYADVDFAVVGDFGNGTIGPPPTPNGNALAVSNFVKNKLNPEFIVTVGDNNYLNSGTTAGWDAAVGQYYNSYIKYPGGSTSQYASNGVTENKFYASLGNHDIDSGGMASYLGTPNGGEYYDFVKGPVHIFVINSDPRSSNDGNLSGAPANSIVAERSTQGQWLKNGLAGSTEAFNIVVFHHPTYSSSASHGSTPYMELPLRAWGASMVLNGHDHTYERVSEPGTNLPFIITGNGGQSLYGFGTPVEGSQARFNSDYGAVRITASNTNLVLSAYDKDTVTLDDPAGPRVNAHDRIEIGLQPKALLAEFQQGFAGYTNAQDTYIRSDQPGTAFASVTSLVVDGDDNATSGNQPTQALIRFDSIIGNNAGQIPDTATIIQARLILTTGSNTGDSSTNTISLYQMATDWNANSTWTTLGDGVTVGTDTLATASDSDVFDTQGSGLSFDVTQALQAWVANPSGNFGWALINTGGTDGWRWNSSEFNTLDLRPMLQVTYIPEPTSVCGIALLGMVGVGRRRKSACRNS